MNQRTQITLLFVLAVCTAGCPGEPPQAHSLSPSYANPAGFTPIVVSGASLSSETTVWIGEVEVQPEPGSTDTELTFIAPVHEAGTVDVRLSNGAGEATLPGALTYVSAPVIHEVLPPVASTAGGEEVIVIGDNFLPDVTELTIGQLPLTDIQWESATRVSARTPAAPAGRYTISVATPTGNQSLAEAFDVRAWTGSQTGMDESELWAIVSAPERPGLLFVATRNGTIFRSGDAGQTWRRIGNGLSPNGAPALVRAPGDPAALFSVCGRNSDICRSTNGGISWTPVLSQCCGNDVVFDHATGTLHAAGHFFHAASSDRGVTWEVHPHELSLYRLALDPSDDSRLFALAAGGHLHRSDDGGVTWVQVGTGLPQDANYLPTVTVTSSGVVIVSAFYDGIYRSTDHGQTFTMVQPGNFEAAAVDPTAPSRLLLAGSELVESTDEGATWTLLAETPDAALSLEITEQGEVLIGTRAQGLFEFDEEFVSLNLGLSAPTVESIRIGQDGSLYTTTAARSAYASADDGKTWSMLGDRAENSLSWASALVTADGTRPIRREGGEVEYLVDGTWLRIWPGERVFTHLMPSPLTPGEALAMQHDHAFFTTDGGDTWIEEPVPFVGLIRNVTARVVDGATEYVVLADEGVYRRGPQGWTWQAPCPELIYRTPRLAQTAGGALFVQSPEDGIWRLPPGGEAWERLPLADGTGLGTAMSGADRVLVAIELGAMVSENGGESWRLEEFTRVWAYAPEFAIREDDPSQVLGALQEQGLLQTRIPLSP